MNHPNSTVTADQWSFHKTFDDVANENVAYMDW